LCTAGLQLYVRNAKRNAQNTKHHINISPVVHFTTLTIAFCRTLHRYSFLMTKD
jgi:hypothetical protein